MKKFAILAAGVAMSLAVVVPAFAGDEHHDEHHAPQTSLTIDNHNTDLTNHVFTVANSGFNLTGGSIGPTSQEDEDEHHHGSTGGDITTGGNVVASSALSNFVNFTQLVTCGCFDNVEVTNRDTDVNNFVFTFANSGFNRTGSSDINTGGHVGAESLVLNDVNTTIFGSVTP